MHINQKLLIMVIIISSYNLIRSRITDTSETVHSDLSRLHSEQVSQDSNSIVFSEYSQKKAVGNVLVLR